MKTEALILERTYHAPISKVWRAITNRDQMVQWYFDLKEFKPEVGFEFQFEAGDKGDMFLHKCVVTAVEEGRKIAYTWSYPELSDGISEVTFELFEEGDHTRLKLTHTGLESFPQDHPSFARTSFNAGWTHILGISLKEFVEK